MNGMCYMPKKAAIFPAHKYNCFQDNKSPQKNSMCPYRIILNLVSLTSLQGSFAYETGIQSFMVDPENPVYCSADGVVFSKDMTKLVCVPDGYAATEYTIPDSVTEIGKEAFFYCRGLKAVIIPDSVKKIGDSAFQECKSLNTVSIPDSVTSIGEYAFSGCAALTGITIPASVTALATAFDDYTPLRSITVDPENPVYCSVDGVVFSKDMTTINRICRLFVLHFPEKSHDPGECIEARAVCIQGMQGNAVCGRDESGLRILF